MCEAFQITAAEHADAPALRLKDSEFEASWAEYAATVRRRAAGFAALGVGRGDTVGFMLVNRPALHLCDGAAMHLGAACFSVYNTSSPEQVEYLVADAANRVIVTEQAFLERVLEARERVPTLEHVVVVDGEPPAGTISLAELEAMGEEGLRLRGRLARGRARRRALPDLHLRHHRAAEGGAADPRQHGRRVAGLRPGLRRSSRAGAASPSCPRPTSPIAGASSTRRCSTAAASTAAPTRARWSPTRPRCGRPSGAGCRGSGKN